MLRATTDNPESDTGNAKLSAQLLDKRGVAAMLKLSPRSISNLMEKGLPHFSIGCRRTRFLESDVLAWLQNNCRASRIGKLNGQPSAR